MGKFKVTGGLSHGRAFGSTGPAQVGMQLTLDKPRKGLIMKTKSTESVCISVCRQGQWLKGNNVSPRDLQMLVLSFANLRNPGELKHLAAWVLVLPLSVRIKVTSTRLVGKILKNNAGKVPSVMPGQSETVQGMTSQVA